jgi:hypothetical protein
MVVMYCIVHQTSDFHLPSLQNYNGTLFYCFQVYHYTINKFTAAAFTQQINIYYTRGPNASDNGPWLMEN